MGVKKMTCEWISVSNELPRIDRKVLMFLPDREIGEQIEIGILTHFGFYMLGKTNDRVVDIVVSHWMPLPLTPRSQK